MTLEEMQQSKIIQLHHAAMELSGVIAEFRTMPCSSLEQRMFATHDRYQRKLRECAPSVTLDDWNARLRDEDERHEAFLKQFPTDPVTGDLA